MQDNVDRVLAGTRFTMLVLVGFAAASLLLAAIGLYGTLAYLAAQPTQEFGVRMALGAAAGQIVTSVAREGLGLSAIGVVALAAALSPAWRAARIDPVAALRAE